MDSIFFAIPRLSGGVGNAEAECIGEFLEETLEKCGFAGTAGPANYQRTRPLLNHFSYECRSDWEWEERNKLMNHFPWEKTVVYLGLCVCLSESRWIAPFLVYIEVEIGEQKKWKACRWILKKHDVEMLSATKNRSFYTRWQFRRVRAFLLSFLTQKMCSPVGHNKLRFAMMFHYEKCLFLVLKMRLVRKAAEHVLSCFSGWNSLYIQDDPRNDTCTNTKRMSNGARILLQACQWII